MDVRGIMRKYEKVVEEGRGPKALKSKSPKDQRSKGPKDQDILKSHSNTSLTLKKVHLLNDKFPQFKYKLTTIP